MAESPVSRGGHALLGLARRNHAILVTFDARLKGLARSAAEVEILL